MTGTFEPTADARPLQREPRLSEIAAALLPFRTVIPEELGYCAHQVVTVAFRLSWRRLGKMCNQSKDNAENDVGAFHAIFLTFFPKVRAMLMRQGADKETAEEIAQDTMLAVWRKRHQFSSDRGKISAWIYAIARNLRIDRIRRQIVWQRSYAEWETIERLQGEAVEAEPWVGERHEIESALQGLPPEQLEIIQLSFIDGLSQAEIAEKLALPLGTVKSRMRLAFKRLRTAVEREK